MSYALVIKRLDMKEQDSVASAGSDNFSVISWKNFIDYASAEKSDNMQNRGKSEVSRKYSWLLGQFFTHS